MQTHFRKIIHCILVVTHVLVFSTTHAEPLNAPSGRNSSQKLKVNFTDASRSIVNSMPRAVLNKIGKKIGKLKNRAVSFEKNSETLDRDLDQFEKAFQHENDQNFIKGLATQIRNSKGDFKGQVNLSGQNSLRMSVNDGKHDHQADIELVDYENRVFRVNGKRIEIGAESNSQQIYESIFAALIETSVHGKAALEGQHLENARLQKKNGLSASVQDLLFPEAEAAPIPFFPITLIIYSAMRFTAWKALLLFVSIGTVVGLYQCKVRIADKKGWKELFSRWGVKRCFWLGVTGAIVGIFGLDALLVGVIDYAFLGGDGLIMFDIPEMVSGQNKKTKIRIIKSGRHLLFYDPPKCNGMGDNKVYFELATRKKKHRYPFYLVEGYKEDGEPYLLLKVDDGVYFPPPKKPSVLLDDEDYKFERKEPPNRLVTMNLTRVPFSFIDGTLFEERLTENFQKIELMNSLTEFVIEIENYCATIDLDPKFRLTDRVARDFAALFGRELSPVNGERHDSVPDAEEVEEFEYKGMLPWKTDEEKEEEREPANRDVDENLEEETVFENF